MHFIAEPPLLEHSSFLAAHVEEAKWITIMVDYLCLALLGPNEMSISFISLQTKRY